MGLGEIPVTLILSGHGHNRAGAISHQDVIGNVQRYRFTGEWVEKKRAGVDPAFIQGAFSGGAIGFTGLPA